MKNEHKVDRRISRTRRSLREALFALVLERGYDAVTIEDITEKADLGRTTFYLHYRDKEDLLMESLRELVDDLIGQLSRLPWVHYTSRIGEAPSGGMLVEAITLTFRNVEQNASLYRLIFRGEGTYSAIQRLREIIIQAITDLLHELERSEKLALNPQVPLEVYLHSLAGAWIGLVTWWLEHDMPYPPEEMAAMYQRMFMQATRDVLGFSRG
jgi:AcrR family transcriptional regulator